MLSRGNRGLLSIPGEQRLCRSCRAVGGQASPREFRCVCSGCFPWICLVFRLLYFQGMRTDGWERGFWEAGGSGVPRRLCPFSGASVAVERCGEARLFTCSPHHGGRLVLPVLLMIWLSLPHSPQSVRLSGSRGLDGPVPQAHPALASCSLGSQPWRAPLRLRCGAGFVPAPSRRLWECLGRECLRRECLGRVTSGRWQRSASPRGSEGGPCSPTFVGGFLTRDKGTGLLLHCKWATILLGSPAFS